MWIVWLFLFGGLHLVAGYRQNRPSRIIGGNPVEIDSVPYMASLRSNDLEFLCGASIVDEWFILTAAHCVEKHSLTLVVVASSRLDENGDKYNKYTVDNIIVHPNYSENTLEYDAALLRVSKPIVLSEDVQIITLPDQEEKLKEGDLLTATGWGTTETADMPKNLLIVQIPFVPRKICQSSYNGGITENMLCAGKEGQDTCWGDSGGPLVYKSVQVGITSFGKDLCGTTEPGVYTRVYSIRHWISMTIRGS